MRVLSIVILSMLATNALAIESEADVDVSEKPPAQRVQLASVDSVKLTSAYVIGGEVDLATMREDLDLRLKTELEQDLGKQASELD